MSVSHGVIGDGCLVVASGVASCAAPLTKGPLSCRQAAWHVAVHHARGVLIQSGMPRLEVLPISFHDVPVCLYKCKREGERERGPQYPEESHNEVLF